MKAIGSGSSIYLVEKLGRKMCLIISELLVGTSLLSLGTYFYMQDNSCLSKDYEGKVRKHIAQLLLTGLLT